MIKPYRDMYLTTRDITYRDVTVPKGYLTDGISYKFRLVGVFINKFDPRYMEAVIVHDYLTDQNDWKKANQYFEELLPNTITAIIMTKAVKIYKLIKGY